MYGTLLIYELGLYGKVVTIIDYDERSALIQLPGERPIMVSRTEVEFDDIKDF